MFKKLGPGVLIAAAFIGPGTVTTCTIAGSKYGFALLWAMILSIIATIVLQEMSARIGVVTQSGLADAIKNNIGNNILRGIALAIIMGAIVIGNAAYEGGNIGGATLGMSAIFGEEGSRYYSWIIGLLAGVLLYIGNYKLVEKVLVTLVIIMSISFIISAIMTKPDLGSLVKSMFVPSLPEGSLLTIIALVGTTVVPYNLFLHTSLASEKWKTTDELTIARWDTIIAIILGGLVSMAIIIAASSMQGQAISGAGDLAKSLEPLYGSSAKLFIGIGLFAAGITSAITAPLAAAYVANSCFGWNAGLKDTRFRLVWLGILLLGIGSLAFNVKPIEIIYFAQVANGILLPAIAIFLLWIVNTKRVMGTYTNTPLMNIVSVVIILIALGLGLKSIASVLNLI